MWFYDRDHCDGCGRPSPPEAGWKFIWFDTSLTLQCAFGERGSVAVRLGFNHSDTFLMARLASVRVGWVF